LKYLKSIVFVSFGVSNISVNYAITKTAVSCSAKLVEVIGIRENSAALGAKNFDDEPIPEALVARLRPIADQVARTAAKRIGRNPTKLGNLGIQASDLEDELNSEVYWLLVRNIRDLGPTAERISDALWVTILTRDLIDSTRSQQTVGQGADIQANLVQRIHTALVGELGRDPSPQELLLELTNGLRGDARAAERHIDKWVVRSVVANPISIFFDNGIDVNYELISIEEPPDSSNHNPKIDLRNPSQLSMDQLGLLHIHLLRQNRKSKNWSLAMQTVHETLRNSSEFNDDTNTEKLVSGLLNHTAANWGTTRLRSQRSITKGFVTDLNGHERSSLLHYFFHEEKNTGSIDLVEGILERWIETISPLEEVTPLREWDDVRVRAGIRSGRLSDAVAQAMFTADPVFLQSMGRNQNTLEIFREFEKEVWISFDEGLAASILFSPYPPARRVIKEWQKRKRHEAEEWQRHVESLKQRFLLYLTTRYRKLPKHLRRVVVIDRAARALEELDRSNLSLPIIAKAMHTNDQHVAGPQTEITHRRPPFANASDFILALYPVAKHRHLPFNIANVGIQGRSPSLIERQKIELLDQTLNILASDPDCRGDHQNIADSMGIHVDTFDLWIRSFFGSSSSFWIAAYDRNKKRKINIPWYAIRLIAPNTRFKSIRRKSLIKDIVDHLVLFTKGERTILNAVLSLSISNDVLSSLVDELFGSWDELYLAGYREAKRRKIDTESFNQRLIHRSVEIRLIQRQDLIPFVLEKLYEQKQIDPSALSMRKISELIQLSPYRIVTMSNTRIGIFDSSDQFWLALYKASVERGKPLPTSIKGIQKAL